MLLHRLAGQGVVCLVCIVIVGNLGFVGFGLSAISQPRYWLARTSLKWPILCLVRRKTLLHQSIWMPFRATSPYTVQDAVDCYTSRVVCLCIQIKRVEIFLLPNLVMGRGEFVHRLLCAMPLVAKLYYINQSRPQGAKTSKHSPRDTILAS